MARYESPGVYVEELEPMARFDLSLTPVNRDYLARAPSAYFGFPYSLPIALLVGSALSGEMVPETVKLSVAPLVMRDL